MSTATVPAAARAARTGRVRTGEQVRSAGAVVVPMARYRGVSAQARAGSAPDRPAAPAPLRLTRRGRRLLRLAAVGLVLLVAVAAALVGRTAQAGSEVVPVVAERVVLPGETLWQIAAEVAPDVDRRETVAQLVDLNGLQSSRVEAGRRLAVPVYSDGR